MVRNLNTWELSEKQILHDLESELAESESLQQNLAFLISNSEEVKSQVSDQTKMKSKIPYVVQLLNFLHQQEQRQNRTMINQLKKNPLDTKRDALEDS